MAHCLDRPTAKACAATGLDPAAFEDLLATDLPDGRNLADEYLRRRGWKESAAPREYIAGLRHSAISIYEVMPVIAVTHRGGLLDWGGSVATLSSCAAIALRTGSRVSVGVVIGRAPLSGPDRQAPASSNLAELPDYRPILLWMQANCSVAASAPRLADHLEATHSAGETAVRAATRRAIQGYCPAWP